MTGLQWQAAQTFLFLLRAVWRFFFITVAEAAVAPRFRQAAEAALNSSGPLRFGWSALKAETKRLYLLGVRSLFFLELTFTLTCAVFLAFFLLAFFLPLFLDFFSVVSFLVAGFLGLFF